LYFEVRRQLGAFSSMVRRACSTSLFFRSTSTFCSASCLASTPAPGWSAGARPAGLELGGELLRLLQQVLGPHRGLDGVQHHADGLRELLEERQVRLRERVQRRQLDDGLFRPRTARQHTMLVGRAAPRLEWIACGARHLVEQNALLLDGGLPTSPSPSAMRLRPWAPGRRSRAAATATGVSDVSAGPSGTRCPAAALTSGASSDSSIRPTVTSRAGPAAGGEPRQVVFSQSCSWFDSVVARRLPIMV